LLIPFSPILRLIGVTQPKQQAGINGGLALWNLFTTLTAAQFVERIGRRPLWLTGHVGVLCTFIVVTGLSGSFATTRESSTGIAVIPFLFIFYLFYNMAWATLANLCEFILRIPCSRLTHRCRRNTAIRSSIKGYEYLRHDSVHFPRLQSIRKPGGSSGYP
jgi:hypothetical protein